MKSRYINSIQKIKGMSLLCWMLFCNPQKLKKFSPRKITKPLDRVALLFILWLPYAVLLVCPAATLTPHTQQRQTVGFGLFQQYQQRQKN